MNTSWSGIRECKVEQLFLNSQKALMAAQWFAQVPPVVSYLILLANERYFLIWKSSLVCPSYIELRNSHTYPMNDSSDPCIRFSSIIHGIFSFVPFPFPLSNTKAMSPLLTLLPGFIFTSAFNCFLPFEQVVDIVFSLALYLNLETQNTMG